jgi:dienelactone hydrolase
VCIALSALLVYCASAPPNPPKRPTTPEPPRAAATPEPTPQLKLPENAQGILGGTQDETRFEWDVEVPEHAVPPILDGVPPASRTVLRTLTPYLQTRQARLSAVSGDGRSMLVLTRLAETTQVHLLDGPLRARRQLTFGRQPVMQAAFGPGEQSITYRSDVGGNEDFQILGIDVATRAFTRYSDGQSRHGPFRWHGQRLAFTSSARNGTDMDLYLREADATTPELVLERAGQWIALSFSRNGELLLMQEFAANDQSTVHLVNLKERSSRPLHPLTPGVVLRGGSFSSNGEFVYLISDRNSDYLQAYEIRLSNDTWRPLTAKMPWDIEELALSPDGRTIAVTANEDGLSRLYLVDIRSGYTRRLRNVPDGQIANLRFVGKTANLAFSLTTPTRPFDAYTYETGAQRLVPWTASELGGVPESRLVVPSLLRYKSFDGLEIPLYYFRPRGAGPFPVLIWVHGGPEEQYRPGFDPIIQYFAAQRGVAVLAPNVRGSSGYGRRYLSLDNGMRRHEAVDDIGALLDWIAGQPELDTNRVGIHGASYGGFMVLASLVKYGKRIAAGSDLVGISNLVTFLENTRRYRQASRRAEYGDESDPEIRRYLQSISPALNAHAIESALFVAHGANDPRVPVREAEQLVEAVRSNGREVWYMLAPSEGHAFRNRQVRDAFYAALGTFFERFLIERPPPTADSADSADHPRAANPNDAGAPTDPSPSEEPGADPPARGSLPEAIEPAPAER